MAIDGQYWLLMVINGLMVTNIQLLMAIDGE